MDKQKRICAATRWCSRSAIAKKGMAMILNTVILLASVIDLVFPEDLGEGDGVGPDPEPEPPIGRFLSKNFGVFMNECQPRSVRIGDEYDFFGPLLGEFRLDRLPQLSDALACLGR